MNEPKLGISEPVLALRFFCRLDHQSLIVTSRKFRKRHPRHTEGVEKRAARSRKYQAGFNLVWPSMRGYLHPARGTKPTSNAKRAASKNCRPHMAAGSIR